jgi:protein arginine kinase
MINNILHLVNFRGDLQDYFDRQKMRVCPNCGYEFDNYVETGRLGCSKCYDTFYDDIRRQIQIPNHPKVWASAGSVTEKMNNLIVSSRIRLARNLEDIPFKTKTKGIFNGIADTICKHNKHFVSTPAAKLSPEMSQALFEQHLVSRELLASIDTSVIVASPDNKVVIMLGEEDHIRIQSLQTGADLATAYDNAKKIDGDIVREHSIAWRKDFGFLTSCPTNLGAGMRSSVMIFLPALTITGQIELLAEQLSNARLTVRGVYGEGGEIEGGYMYQISNQACIDMTEKQILDMVKSVTVQIAKFEIEAQNQIYRENPDEIIDAVMRSWGILTNAYMLSTSDAVEHLAKLKLGACLGIVKFKNQRILDDLFFIIRPATMATADARAGDTTERDKIRAKRVAEYLKSQRV